ncbi:kinase-like domain-containing protein [Rhizophagus diaphanus]|nr:kinase-like domain-containing protein [Rhizophagus diaphanus] [Rhizophagus sp. MUCL 43196]
MASGTDKEAINPYLPLITTALNLINKVTDIYTTAEYNKNICEALVSRVKLTENAINTLQRRKQRNEDKFRNDDYYKAFNRFIYILEDIKSFAEDISTIHCFRKYTEAYLIKESFQKLTNDYDVAMKDLHFTMAVADEEQRSIDFEAMEIDLAEMNKYLKKMYTDILEKDNKVDMIHNMVKHMINHYDKPSHDVNKIKVDSKDLTPPSRGRSDDERGKGPNFVIRKIYKKGQEVACKTILNNEEECSKTQKVLEILTKLFECKHILRFYGISTIDNHDVMVFEWAERGTLKQFYEQKRMQITLHCKLRIALGICRGLIFLQHVNILHHDLKCKNILMTESLEPKIYNFELARPFDGISNSLPTDQEKVKDIIPWLAPEKLNHSRYTTQCEIFSFGMLFWELTFEKIPYQDWEIDRIRDHVTKGGREGFTFGDLTPENKKIKKIIKDTWKQEPQERISFMKLLDMLEELYGYVRTTSTNDSSDIHPNKLLGLDRSKETDLELPVETIIKPIISLEEGIRAFKKKEYQKAWDCFDFHTKNNNTTAKYWKGRYLWEGYLDGIKEREEGRILLKEAADEGNTDAQLRYAFTFKQNLDKEENRQIFLKYLKTAANEGNKSAQFNLGDIYYKGKCNFPKNENEGIQWLLKAAYQNNFKADKLLKTLDKDIYDAILDVS